MFSRGCPFATHPIRGGRGLGAVFWYVCTGDSGYTIYGGIKLRFYNIYGTFYFSKHGVNPILGRCWAIGKYSGAI